MLLKLYLQPNQGFTMVELLTAVAIVGIVFIGFFNLQNFMIQQQEYTFNSYLSVETANAAMQTMSKEIRNLRNSDAGAHYIETADDQELIFYSNADNDPEIERIRYFLQGTILKKGVINPTTYPISYPTENESISILNEHIQNNTSPIFYYHNGSWPKDTTNDPLDPNLRLTQTRAIEIHLIVNSNPQEMESNHELRSIANIRTIKDNL